MAQPVYRSMTEETPNPSPAKTPVKKFSTRVAGIHYNKGDVYGLEVGGLLRLVREPNNPYDSNAVRVEMPTGTVVGWIPREIAASLARDMDAGLPAHAVIEWTAIGHAPIPSVYSRRGKLRKRGTKASPPECHVCVRVGGIQPPMPQPQAPPPPALRPAPPAIQKAMPVQKPSPAPQHTAERPKTCFVATAVFRDAENETVVALRQWRDNQLSQRRFGRLLIHTYQVVGPHLAKLVHWWPQSRVVFAPLLTGLARALQLEHGRGRAKTSTGDQSPTCCRAASFSDL